MNKQDFDKNTLLAAINASCNSTSPESDPLLHPAPGQFHPLAAETDMWEAFVLVLERNGDICQVIPGSMDPLKGGPSDILIPAPEVPGQYWTLNLGLKQELHADAILPGFASLTPGMLNYVKYGLNKFELGEPLGNKFRFCLPYIGKSDSRRAYRDELAALVKKAEENATAVSRDQENLAIRWPGVNSSSSETAKQDEKIKHIQDPKNGDSPARPASLETSEDFHGFKWSGDRASSSRIIRFAVAASIFVCLGLFVFIGIGRFESPAKPNYPEISSIRGKNVDANSFITNVKGDVIIARNGENGIASYPFEPLYTDDIVNLEKDAVAWVLYENAMYELQGPNSYRVGKDELTATDAAKETNPVSSSKSEKNLISAPSSLLAQLAFINVRGDKDTVPIFSPNGKITSNKPVVRIGGNPEKTYLVSIVDSNNKAVGSAREIRGLSSHDWTEFVQEPIKDDETYFLTITSDGKILNGDNNAFWFPSQENTALKESTTVISRIDDSVARKFFLANILYTNGFYSDAYLVLDDISWEKTVPDAVKQLKTMILGRLGIPE